MRWVGTKMLLCFNTTSHQIAQVTIVHVSWDPAVSHSGGRHAPCPHCLCCISLTPAVGTVVCWHRNGCNADCSVSVKKNLFPLPRHLKELRSVPVIGKQR